MPKQLRDATDEQTALLQKIARNTDGLGPTATPSEGGKARPFLVTETSQLDHADADGAVTVNPGETVVLAEYQVTGTADLLAFGATDQPDSEYELVVDHDSRFTTFSPLGLLNEPFSLQNQLGFTYPANKQLTYKVSLDESADGPQRYAARLYVSERSEEVR